MTITPRRIVLAVAFGFLLLNLRPLLAANPSRNCDTPMLFKAAQAKNNLSEFPQRGSGIFGPRFETSEGREAAAENGCIQEARDEVGATATRLAFFAVLGGGVVWILGWRPRRREDANLPG